MTRRVRECGKGRDDDFSECCWGLESGKEGEGKGDVERTLRSVWTAYDRK